MLIHVVNMMANSEQDASHLVLSRNLFVARVRHCQGDIQIIDLYSPVAAEKTPV